MKLTEFRKLIREEVRKVLSEESPILPTKLPTVIAKLTANASKVGMKELNRPHKGEGRPEPGIKVIKRWGNVYGFVLLYQDIDSKEYGISFGTGYDSKGDITSTGSGNDEYTEWLSLNTWKQYYK